MSNFRTKLFGLAGVAMAFSGAAYGQLTCTATPAPAPILIRAEGTTEQLPATQITCAAPALAATPAGNINIQDFTSLPITSKVLNTTAGLTEAVVQYSNNGGAITLPATGAYATISGTSATWTIPVPIVAAATNIVFTISNIRVNANGAVATTGAPTPVTEQFFITGPVLLVTAASPAALTVGYVENGLAVAKNFTTIGGAVPGSVNFVTCTSSNLVNGQNLGLATVVSVSENFATAFKSNLLPGPVVSELSEVPVAAGVYNAVTLLSNATNAGTRFQVALANVPSGVTVYVPINLAANAGNGSTAALTGSASGTFSAVSATTPSSSNGLATAAGVQFAVPVAALSISGGAGTAVYEIAGNLGVSDQTSIATFQVPIYLYAAANTITATSTAMTLTDTFAPTGSTVIPNFTSTGSTTTLTSSVWSLCTTSLLFPFVTNQVGFDTGISIANTSTDPFGSKLGAVPQSGTCTLSFYGNGAPTPASVTGPNVPTGTSYTFQLSSVAPGFQGYMIAQCNFQYAHGFGFATNGATDGNAATAFSYLAGIIPNGAATARAAGAGNAGEALGQ